MKYSNCLLGLALAASSAAVAQTPGTVDPVKATAASQADRSGYNSALGQLGPRGIKGAPVPATASDIVPGRPLRDIKGEPIARVEKVDSQGVIVTTTTGKVRLPANAFGKDELGLLLGITAGKFRSLVTKVTTARTGG